jgi:hypothetical protein
MYSPSNTTAENLRITRNVSTIGCLQSVPNTQTPKFKVILDQQVQARTTHLSIANDTVTLYSLIKLHIVVMLVIYYIH